MVYWLGICEKGLVLFILGKCSYSYRECYGVFSGMVNMGMMDIRVVV